MPEQPHLGPARALRAYLPKLQGYDDTAVTQLVREVYQSGDPQRIARLTADIRRYVPRYGQMDDEATAREIAEMFGVQPQTRPQGAAPSVGQPARSTADYLQSLYSQTFAAQQPNVADMATVMNQVTAPSIPQIDRASVAQPAVAAPAEPAMPQPIPAHSLVPEAAPGAAPVIPPANQIAKSLRAAQKVERIREAGAIASAQAGRTPKDVQDLDFGRGINKGVQKRAEQQAAQNPLAALYSTMAGQPIPGIPNPNQILAGGETLANPQAGGFADPINRMAPLEGPGFEADAFGNKPAALRPWEQTVPASRIAEDIARTFPGRDGGAIVRNIRKYVKKQIPALEAQLAELPSEQFVTDPLIPNPVPVGDEYSGQRRALRDAIGRLRAIEKTPKNIAPQNALKGIVDAFVNAPTDVVGFLGDVHGMVKEAEITMIEEKIGRGTATPEEKAQFDAYQMEKQFAQFTPGDPYYQGGKMIPAMVSYGTQFKALEPVRKGVEKFFTRNLVRAFGGGSAQRQAARMLAPIVGGAAAGAVDAPGIARGMTERMQNYYQMGVSPAGEVLYRALEGEGDKWLAAALKSAASRMSEYGTEQFGETLVALKRAFVGRVMRAKGVDPTDVQKAMQAVKEGIGWQGMPYEIAEEEVNEPIQAWIDGREYESPITSPKGHERLVSEIIGIGIFGAPFSLVNARERRIEKATERVREQQKADRTDAALDALAQQPMPGVARPLQDLYAAMAGAKAGAQVAGDQKGSMTPVMAPDLRQRLATERMQERVGNVRMDARKLAGADGGVDVGAAEGAANKDREDYEAFLRESGVTAEQARKDSHREDDLRPTPPGEADRVRLGPSEIEGRGVISTQAFPAGTPIATSVINGGRTDIVGRYINHAAEPNTRSERQPDGRIMIVAARDIQPGDELTMDYRMPEILGGATIPPIAEPDAATPDAAAPEAAAPTAPAGDLKKERADIIKRLRAGELDPIEAVRQYGERHPKMQTWQAYRDANKPVGEMKYRGKSAQVFRTADGVELVTKAGERLGQMSMAEYQRELDKREKAGARAAERGKNLVLISPDALENMPATAAIFGRKVGDQTGDMLDDVRVGINQVRSKPLVDKKSAKVDYDLLHEFLAESSNEQHQAWAAQGWGFTEVYEKALDEITRYQSGQITGKSAAGEGAASNPLERLDTYLDSLRPDEFVDAWQTLDDKQKKGYVGEEYQDMTPDQIAQYDRVYLNGEWYKVRTEGGKSGEVVLEDGTTIRFDRVFEKDKQIPIEKTEKSDAAPASQAPSQESSAEDTGAAALPEGLSIIKNPAGTFSYVGKVPVNVGYVDAKTGNPPTSAQIAEFQKGVNAGSVRLAMQAAGLKSNALPTMAEAEDYARRMTAQSQAKQTPEAPAAPGAQGDMFGAPAGNKKLSAEDEYGLKNPAQLAGRERAEKRRKAEEQKAAAERRAAELKRDIAQYRQELKAAPAADKPRVKKAIEKAQKDLAKALQQARSGDTMFAQGTADVFEEPEATSAEAPSAPKTPQTGGIAEKEATSTREPRWEYIDGTTHTENMILPGEHRATGTIKAGVRNPNSYAMYYYPSSGAVEELDEYLPEQEARDYLAAYVPARREYDRQLDLKGVANTPDGKGVVKIVGNERGGFTTTHEHDGQRDHIGNANSLAQARRHARYFFNDVLFKPPKATQGATPKDGWRDNLIKAREYALNLGMNLSGTKPGEPSRGYTVSRDTWTNLNLLVDAIDGYLAQKAAPSTELADESAQPPAAEPAQPSAADKARAELEELKKKFLSQVKESGLGANVDPNAMATAAQIAIKYAEIGVLKFGEFAREAIDLVGEAIKPYLKGAYLMAKQQMPRETRRTMDSEDTVEDFDLDETISASSETNAPAAETPAAEPEFMGDRAAQILNDAGLTVRETRTNNGKPVWEVSGNTRAHLETMKALKGRWYGPKKVWSFYNGDPTEAIAQRIRPSSVAPQAKPNGRPQRVPEAQGDLSAAEWRGLAGTRVLVAGRPATILSMKGAAAAAVRQFPNTVPVEYDNEPGSMGVAFPEQISIAPASVGAQPPKQQPATQTAAPPATSDAVNITAFNEMADQIESYFTYGKPLTHKELITYANAAYGGTMGEGAYTAADMYDALEYAVNRYLTKRRFSGGRRATTDSALADVQNLREILKLLPTQRIRTEEKDEMQQFSTPPHIAYLVNWLADVRESDTVLEPSAGTGGIALFPANAGAQVFTNELSPRRAAILRALGIGEVFEEDAEMLDNILPDRVAPTVVEMNPPYSSTQRIKGQRNTANATIHLEQALRRLESGGRLVAVVGEGMTLSEETTDPSGRRPSGKLLAPWWKDLMKRYNVRANIGIAGKEYSKYGTGWPLRILVIDKTGPTTAPVVDQFFETIEQAIKNSALQEIRDGRPQTVVGAEPAPSQPGRSGSAAGPGRTVGQESTAPGAADRGGAGTSGNPLAERGSAPRPADGGRAAGPARSGEGAGMAGGERSGPRTPEKRRAAGGSAASAGSVLDGNDPRFRVTDKNRMTYTADPAREEEQREVNADSQFEEYQPQRMAIDGAKPHPGNLVESAAMASVQPPSPTYVPMLSREFIESGTLSEAQLEAIIYAGQAHEQELTNGTRRGFFIGDGTGVGKGREIGGVILDNWNQGRRRHIWITKNQALFDDAVRDVKALFGEEADAIIHNLSDTKIDKDIAVTEGIVFVTYNTLIGKSKKAGRTRIQQLLEWAGEDFDGVIAFDEAHKMGSALDMKGNRGIKKASQTALSGLAVVDGLRDARVLYASATGATEVDNLGYLDRLGLWGPGTAFANKRDFVSSISAGGLNSMEMAARDMKALGLYIARSLSYQGVQYRTLVHELSPEQKQMHQALVEAWRLVFDNFNAALELTAGVTDRHGETRVDGRTKGRAMSAFWGANQRFWAQIITSMKAGAMIADMEKEIAAGNATLVQLVNTFEAQQERKLADLDEDEDLEMLDMTPRDGLMQLVEHSFPVNVHREVEDENGNRHMELVKDKNGNPVQDKEAVRMRDALLDRLASVRVPDAPIDMIVNTFGPDAVAEITGRRRRVVRTVDEKGRQQTVIEARSKAKRDAELARFRDDKMQILVFSDAGGTGASYHADRNIKNQRQRVQYVFQPGFIANNAMQGLGRAHRTNQASAPIFVLVTTDLPGEKRFMSSIARRLQQLGALTRGQRDASAGGLFSERDNLESQIARDALQQFYKDLYKGDVREITREAFEDMTGLVIVDTDGNLLQTLPPIPQFLNRMLNMPIDTQNAVFEAISSRIDAQIETARRNGTLDVGMETIRANSVSVVDEQVLYTDARSQAETRYLELELKRDATVRRFDDGANLSRQGWAVNRRSGRIYSVSDGPPLTDKYGRVVERLYLDGVSSGKFVVRDEFDEKRYQIIADPKDAKTVWDAEYEQTPKTKTEKAHLITGALLPVWDRIDKEQSRVYRVVTDNGRMILGRVIPEAKLQETLRRLGAEARGITYEPADVLAKILDSNYSATFTNNWRLQRSIVDGEERIEFMAHKLGYGDDYRLEQLGAVRERRDYRMRVFLPTGQAGVKVLKALAAEGKSVVQMDAPDNGEDELDAIAATVHRARRPNAKKNTPPPTGTGGNAGNASSGNASAAAGQGPGSPAAGTAAGAAGTGSAGAAGQPAGPAFQNAPKKTKVYQPGPFTQAAPETAEARAISARLLSDREGKKVGMRTIVDWLSAIVHAETRVGSEQTSRRHPAHFESASGLIRTQSGHSATYNMHEIGHAISAFLRDRNRQTFRGLGDELKAFAIASPYASAHSAEEGLAEWIRLFVTDYRQIQGLPLTMEMERRLEREAPEILRALRDANRLHWRHVSRGIRAVRRSINNDKGIAPPIMQRVHDGIDMLLFRAVASRHAIEHVRRTLWRGWKRTVPVPKLTKGRWLENVKSINEYMRNRKAASARAREWEAKMKDSPADMMSAYATILRLPQEIDYFLRGTGKANRGQRVLATGRDQKGGMLSDAQARALENAGYLVPQGLRELAGMSRRFSAKHGQFVFFDNRLISDIIADIGTGEEWDEFQNYAWDRTDLFRARKLGLDYAGLSDGITKDDLERSVKAYEAQHPEWKGYYDELNQYMDNLAVIAVAGGLIDVEQAVAMKEKHEQYLPLLKEREREMQGYGTSGGVYISAKYHRAFGSELPKIPLLNAIEVRTRQVLSAYYYNRMALAPVRYAEMIRDDNTIPYDVRKQAERVAVELRLDRKKMANLGEDEATKVIAEYLNQQLLAQMKAQDPTVTSIPLGMEISPRDVEVHWSGMGIFRAADPRAVHVIAPMVKGERVFYQVEDPILYEFFARTNQPKSMVSRIVQNWVLPVVSPWKRQITQTLKFVLGNIPRDVTTAMFTGKDIESLIPGYYHIAGMIYKMTGQVPDSVTSGQLLARAYETAFDPAQLLRMNQFQQVLSEGLLVPGWGLMSRGERLRALAMDAPGKLANLIVKPAELILWATGQRKLAELSEESARLGAYYAARKRGLSDEAAQMEYDLITGLFADHPGNPDLSTFARLPGFLNPTNQIMYEWMMRLSDPDAKVRDFHWLKVAYIGALTAVGWAINMLLMGDDEYERLKERTDEERFHFMPIGGILKVPFDNGPLGATQMFTWNLMDSIAGGDKLEADKLAKEFLGKMIAFPTSPVEFMQPQLVTIIENMANYKFYWAKNIVPYWMEAMPAEDQYMPTTPEAYRKLGELLGVSPLKVEHSIRSGVSPVMDEMVRFYDALLGGGVPIRSIDQIPGISTRMQHEPMGWYSRSVVEVSEKAKEFQQTITSLKKKLQLDPQMTLFDAASRLEQYQEDLSERDRSRLARVLDYGDYYAAMSVGDNSIEALFDYAKEARKAALESRKAEDWAVVDEILRDMVARAQQAIREREEYRTRMDTNNQP